jgi:TRAP-type C4-dicarboxylate transport system permease small subunit
VHELAMLALVIGVLMVMVTLSFRWVGPALRVVEQVLLAGSILVILFVAGFVCAEVLMRYAFDSPIPGHLELSEQLMPIIVFFAVSYTQATHGHVGMDLLLDNLAPRMRRVATLATLVISIVVCAILAMFSFKNALQLWRFDDVTMSPPYFPTWPAAAAIPIGYGLLALRMFVQALHFYDPQRFPAHEPAGAHFDGGD